MYAFDNQKLDRHPDRVAAWLRGEPAGPITVEISPTQSCNQRCTFCAFDYRRASISMAPDEVVNMATEVVSRTDWPVQGVTWGGEGEPTLVVNLDRAMERTRNGGAENGLITNGTSKRTPDLAEHCAWIRFSINSLDAGKYAKIHGADPRVLTKVLDNLAKTLEKRPPTTTVGVQMLVFEENLGELLEVGSRMKAFGVDYFVAKPYSKHPKSEHTQDFILPQAQLGALQRDLAQLSTEQYHAELRLKAIAARSCEKQYDHCLAAPFFHLITADQVVYPCAQFVGDRRMALGSIEFQRWAEFLVSSRRMGMLNYLGQIHETSGCRHPCRLDNHNRYLGSVTDHGRHDSFV
jgi:MoaA/NifB/PqqE/SkfB family radical SAM enzyme